MNFVLNTTESAGGPINFISDPTIFFGDIGVGPINAADLNNDGLTELFINGQMFVNTTQQNTLLPSFDAPLGLGRFIVAAEDIDGDGRADVVITDAEPPSTVFLNETIPGASTPSFAAPVEFAINFINVTGDFDGDGKHELIAVDGFENSTLSVGILPFGPAKLSKAQGVGTILPAADTTPARFSFIDRFFVARGQPQVSNAIFVRGINQPAPIAVNGGSYSINNGPYVTSPGLAKNGDRVRVALFAPNQFNTAAHVQLTVGGVSDVFTTRTRGPVLDNFLSRLFGFDFLNQFEMAMAGFNAPAMP